EGKEVSQRATRRRIVCNQNTRVLGRCSALCAPSAFDPADREQGPPLAHPRGADGIGVAARDCPPTHGRPRPAKAGRFPNAHSMSTRPSLSEYGLLGVRPAVAETAL